MELATLYVLEVVRLVRPRFVVPGDSAAILINSKLGVRLSHVCANDCGNCDGPSITAIKVSAPLMVPLCVPPLTALVG